MLLEMRHISRSFPGVRALDDVSITLSHGEVLGIVGENGAGKSTLMKILAGVYPAEQGSILLNGTPFAPSRPRDALEQGIVVIHQELSLVPDRSIAENVFLGNLPRSALGVIKRGALERAAAELLARIGLSLPPQTLVRRLGIAQQQLVEIARALSREARVIVMDEPTATLTESELRILFRTIESLKRAGVGIIFISHHLEEVFEICDRVTVMRDGHTVETRLTSEWTQDSLVQAMVNRPITSFFPKREIELGPTLLEVTNLSAPGRFEKISFSVRAGEIVGLAGLVGAGRTDVLKAIYGALHGATGTVRAGGKAIQVKAPRDAIAAGIALVPEDRKVEGLILPFSVRKNVALSTLDTLAWLRTFTASSRLDAQASQAVRDLRIRTQGIHQPVGSLSGGNQQKVVLARGLTTKPRIFLLDEPTRGIDVGAKVDVYRLIGDLAEAGGAVLIVSSELLELLGLCDRILVMRMGRLTGEITRPEFSQERVMALAAYG